MLSTRRRFIQWLPSLPLLDVFARPAVAAPRKLLMNQFRVATLAGEVWERVRARVYLIG